MDTVAERMVRDPVKNPYPEGRVLVIPSEVLCWKFFF